MNQGWWLMWILDWKESSSECLSPWSRLFLIRFRLIIFTFRMLLADLTQSLIHGTQVCEHICFISQYHKLSQVTTPKPCHNSHLFSHGYIECRRLMGFFAYGLISLTLRHHMGSYLNLKKVIHFPSLRSLMVIRLMLLFLCLISVRSKIFFPKRHSYASSNAPYICNSTHPNTCL